MPQLMPIYWIFSIFMVVFIMLMIFMSFYDSVEEMNYKKEKMIKLLNWEW